MASRILGMGDVLSLVEEARKTVDAGEAKKFAEKVKKGEGFDLEDFKQQIGQMRKMGGCRPWSTSSLRNSHKRRSPRRWTKSSCAASKASSTP